MYEVSCQACKGEIQIKLTSLGRQCIKQTMQGIESKTRQLHVGATLYVYRESNCFTAH